MCSCVPAPDVASEPEAALTTLTAPSVKVDRMPGHYRIVSFFSIIFWIAANGFVSVALTKIIETRPPEYLIYGRTRIAV